MKKNTLYLFILLLISSACKKGPNDPAISLHSRKARVVGEWTIKSGSSTYSTTSSQNKKTNHRFTFTENSYDYFGTDEDNISYVGKGSYFFKIKFEKNGNVKISETYDNLNYTANGTWDFNNGIGDAKSKEQIIINLTYSSFPIGSTNFSGNQTQITYTLTELRNNKMSLYQSSKEDNSDNSSSSTVNTYEMKQ
ncbi:MAG: hypothetical protein ACO1G2_12105 [Bacteroidota bacterium]